MNFNITKYVSAYLGKKRNIDALNTYHKMYKIHNFNPDTYFNNIILSKIVEIKEYNNGLYVLRGKIVREREYYGQ